MSKKSEPKKLGRPPMPPGLRRNARLSMRTYQEIADKAARVGTEAVEAAIRSIKEPIDENEGPNESVFPDQ